MFCAFFTAIEDLEDIKHKLVNFVKWKELGLNLGLSPDHLKVIEADHKLTSERLEAVLFHWLKQNYDVNIYGLPSWSCLADAIEPINNTLAFTVKEQHTLEPQPQSKNSMYVCFDLF